MRFVVLVLAMLMAIPAIADQRVPDIQGARLISPPKIDGVLDAEEWAGASSSSGTLDMESSDPNPDAAEFFIGYDDNYIYVAARLADPNPTAIRAVEYRTNVGLSGDDSLEFRIDPTGNLDSYNSFTMNANGGSSIEIAGGRAIKREWLGEFFTKGRITEKGWEVEARIPWRLMQMPPAGKRDMRVNFVRYTSRIQRQSTWAHNGGMRYYYGHWRGVESPKVPFERKLKLLPYVFGGYDEHDGEIAIGGLDFKTSLNERLEAVGTINPDFRNIEGDILSLDFSYFERLPDDTRPFFQEGSNYIGSMIFASQRIQRFDAGLNLYGKLDDKSTFGLLNTVDFDNETNTVFSAGRKFSETFSIRGGYTRNEGDMRPDNQAAFVRLIQSSGPFQFNYRTAFSEDEVNGYGSWHDFLGLYFKDGVSAHFGYQSVSPGYNPRLSFTPERDLKGYFAGLEFTKQVKTGPLMEWGFGASGFTAERFSGDFYRDEAAANVSLTFRDGLDVDFGHQRSKFLGFDDQISFFSIEKPRGDSYRRWQLDYQTGDVAGMDYESASAAFLYRPIAKLQTSVRYQWLKHFETSEQTILSANWDMGNDMAISGRLVMRDGDTGGYLSFRRAGNRGAEYYFIVGNPNSLKFESSFILKAVFPFELRI